jgi:hypothetical protein
MLGKATRPLPLHPRLLFITVEQPPAEQSGGGACCHQWFSSMVLLKGRETGRSWSDSIDISAILMTLGFA